MRDDLQRWPRPFKIPKSVRLRLSQEFGGVGRNVTWCLAASDVMTLTISFVGRDLI